MGSESYGGYGFRAMMRSLHIDDYWIPEQANTKQDWHVTTQLLLAAAAKANVQPKALCFVGRDRNDLNYYGCFSLTGASDGAFYIPPFMRQMILPVIEGLEELDLHVHNKYGYAYAMTQSLAPCRTRNLREFLGLPVRLRKLRIQLLVGETRHESSAERDEFWTWMGEDTKGKGKASASEQDGDQDDVEASGFSPPPITFPYLQELDISYQNIPVEELMGLLKKVSPTLRKVSLHGLILRDRSEEEHGDEYDGDLAMKAEIEAWAGLCDNMAALPWEDLQEVIFNGFDELGSWYLSKFGGPAGPDSAHFKALRITGEICSTAEAEFSYKGPDVPNALRLLAGDLRAALRDRRHIFPTLCVSPGERRRSF